MEREIICETCTMLTAELEHLREKLSAITPTQPPIFKHPVETLAEKEHEESWESA